MKKCTIDPDHSVATFAIRHLGIAHVRGMFNKLSGCVYYDAADISRSTVEAEIDVTSLSTGIKKRDDHVLSDEMLDAARYPTITFKSTKVIPAAGGKVKVQGELTIHGVTKPAVLEVEYFGPVKSPFGGEVSLGFTARTMVNRKDFGVNWGDDVLDTGGLVAGKEVEITLDVEADLEQ
ncbi:MAG: YceI family protein [Nitrospiraceae bacterium]|nr:YceI family protein [Nitrospiraceae bacterium]